MKKKYKGHLCIVIAIEHYNPLGIIRSLGEEGVTPIFIAIKGKTRIASLSKYVSICHYVASVEEAYSVMVEKYGKEPNKPFIFCADDKTMGYIDNHYDEIKNSFICFNARQTGGINKYMNKWEILQLAEDVDLKYAKTIRCKTGDIPDNIDYPVFTKPIHPNVGGHKADMLICNSKKELQTAYKKIKTSEVLIQEYIDKKNELEYNGISINHGEEVLFTIGTNYYYTIPGYYSPYMRNFEPPYPEVQNKIAAMIKQIGYEGIFSVEFLIDKNEELYFLEINLRNATWSYAATCAGMNQPCLWMDSMINGNIKKTAKKPFSTFSAMVEPIDYSKRVDTGKISIAEWAADFKEAKCTYYYNLEDIEPWKNLCKNWNLLK